MGPYPLERRDIMKKLRDLYDIDSDLEVTGISMNSKEIEKGNIFVCTMGVTADRHDFVDDAIKNYLYSPALFRLYSSLYPLLQ